MEQGSIDKFRESLKGKAFLPSDAEYKKVCGSIWNVMCGEKRKPAIIVQPAGVADIITATAFARDHNLPISAVCGGHNASGRCLAENGLTLDLCQMKGIFVDPVRKTAKVQAGCIWRDLDFELAPFNLAVPGGVVSETGVAGLTLGGGWGYLTKQYGLSADNLLSADIVTSNGEFLHLSESENADLFWAIRGGGGNFGIVTSFEFKLHSISPVVWGGPLAFQATEEIWKNFLTMYNKLWPTLPPKAVCFPGLVHLPPDGTKMGIFVICFYEGPKSEAMKYFKPVFDFGTPVLDMTAERLYRDHQKVLDPLFPQTRVYWKAGLLKALTPEIALSAYKKVETSPSPGCAVLFENYFFTDTWSKTPVNKTAFPHRNHQFCMLIDGKWSESALDEKCTSWVKGTFDEFSKDYLGSYYNFTADESERVFHANKEKLMEIKRKYDQRNVFRSNSNVLL